MSDPLPPSGRSLRPHLSAAWLAVLLLAVALVPFVQELTAQPAVRYAQTAAMVDEHTVVLDDYRSVIGVDHVERGGHYYGDKAPLQPILAMPFYAVARAAGADPGTSLQVHGNLGLWWVTVWCTVVPLLAVAWLGIETVTRLLGPRRAVQAALTICGGTLLLAYGTQLYAHVLAGLLGWGCWLAVDRSLRATEDGGHAGRWALAAGALAGAAVATEYPLAIVVAVMLGVLVLHRAWGRLAAFVAGGVPFALLLVAYQWVAYGSPFTVSYAEKPQHQSEPTVVGLPSPVRLGEVLVGSRGLLLFSPVVALAAWGLWRLARSGVAERRRHGVVGLVVFAGFLLLQAGWQNPWGGEAPGPRYVIPALPFLIVGMAEAWDPAGRIRWLAVRWSALAMAMPVIALHLTPMGSWAVVAQLQWLRSEGPVETLWTMAFGPLGWVLHAATVATVAWYLVARWRQEHAALDDGVAAPAPSAYVPAR